MRTNYSRKVALTFGTGYNSRVRARRKSCANRETIEDKGDIRQWQK